MKKCYLFYPEIHRNFVIIYNIKKYGVLYVLFYTRSTQMRKMCEFCPYVVSFSYPMSL